MAMKETLDRKRQEMATALLKASVGAWKKLRYPPGEPCLPLFHPQATICTIVYAVCGGVLIWGVSHVDDDDDDLQMRFRSRLRVTRAIARSGRCRYRCRPPVVKRHTPSLSSVSVLVLCRVFPSVDCFFSWPYSPFEENPYFINMKD